MLKFKKIAALLITVTSLISLLPQAMAAETADYLYKTAQEADKKTGYVDYYACMAIIADNSELPTLEFDFNLKSDGMYDIWIDASSGYWKTYTGYKLNGDTNIKANSGTQAGDATSGGYQGVETAWHKVDKRSLSAGENTMVVSANGKDIYNRYVSVVKRVAVVPSSWEWSPTDSEKPIAKQFDYYYKTAQEASRIVGYNDNSAYMEILADSAKLPELEFKFNLKTGGLYDIWLDTTSGWWKNYTGYKMNNDTAVKGNEGVQFGDATAADSVGLTTAWHKADTRVLPTGENTLTVSPSQKDAANNRYVSMVKRIAVVPRTYYWDPTKSVTPTECEAPAASEYGFAYATDYAAKSGGWVQSSKRKTTMAVVSSNEAEHTLIYDFNLANDGSYDLWLENVNNDWASYLKYSIDGGEYLPAAGTAVGNATESYDFGISTQWQKINVQNLSKGYHTITFKMEKYSDGRYLGALNAIALSPTEWNWQPTDSEKPKKVYAVGSEIIGASADGNSLKFISQASVEDGAEVSSFGTVIIPLWLHKTGSSDTAVVTYEQAIENGKTFGAAVSNIPQECSTLSIVGMSFIKTADGKIEWSDLKSASLADTTLSVVE